MPCFRHVVLVVVFVLSLSLAQLFVLHRYTADAICSRLTCYQMMLCVFLRFARLFFSCRRYRCCDDLAVWVRACVHPFLNSMRLVFGCYFWIIYYSILVSRYRFTTIIDNLVLDCGEIFLKLLSNSCLLRTTIANLMPPVKSRKIITYTNGCKQSM